VCVCANDDDDDDDDDDETTKRRTVSRSGDADAKIQEFFPLT